VTNHKHVKLPKKKKKLICYGKGVVTLEFSFLLRGTEKWLGAGLDQDWKGLGADRGALSGSRLKGVCVVFTETEKKPKTMKRRLEKKGGVGKGGASWGVGGYRVEKGKKTKPLAQIREGHGEGRPTGNSKKGGLGGGGGG